MKEASESARRTELFLRVQEGETHLFGNLAAELNDLLRWQLRVDTRRRGLTCNAADEDDVLQTTFLRLWELRDRFDPCRGTIDGLAWIIARNAAVSVLRLRARRAKTIPLPDVYEDKHAMKPDARLLAEETHQALALALKRVRNAKVRRALKLRLLVGLPYAAVSKKTGVPLGTVANWIHRLRCWLRDDQLEKAREP